MPEEKADKIWKDIEKYVRDVVPNGEITVVFKSARGEIISGQKVDEKKNFGFE